MPTRSRFIAVAALSLIPAVRCEAARLMAIPLAETLPAGRVSAWQFGLRESRSGGRWRGLNRLDVGLAEGLEFGALAIFPEGRASDTWLNLQARPLSESGWRPAVSVGVWDLARKNVPWFSDRTVGPSPFVAASKTWRFGERYVKVGAGYGSNRLHGLFGGVEVRAFKGTGLMAEYAPENLRLAGAEAWDVGLYQWFGSSWRARVSWMGGNPMGDLFFTWTIGGAR